MSEYFDKKEMLDKYEDIKLNKFEELEMYLKMRGIDYLFPILNEIKNEITDIKTRLNRIEIKTGITEIPINMSDIQNELNKVADYLKTNKEAYPSEIADYLNLSIKDVMNAIQVLKSQKKIEVIE